MLLGFSLGHHLAVRGSAFRLVRFVAGPQLRRRAFRHPRYVLRHCAPQARASSYRRSRVQGAHPPSPDARGLRVSARRCLSCGRGRPFWLPAASLSPGPTYLVRIPDLHFCVCGYGVCHREAAPVGRCYLSHHFNPRRKPDLPQRRPKRVILRPAGANSTRCSSSASIMLIFASERLESSATMKANSSVSAQAYT